MDFRDVSIKIFTSIIAGQDRVSRFVRFFNANLYSNGSLELLVLYAGESGYHQLCYSCTHGRKFLTSRGLANRYRMIHAFMIDLFQDTTVLDDILVLERTVIFCFMVAILSVCFLQFKWICFKFIGLVYGAGIV